MPIRARHRSSPGTARALLLLSVAALVALLAGCGAPEYTYVTNSTDRTYLKVPTSWRPIDDKAMNDAIGFDPPVAQMFERRKFWEAHRVMREREYYHLENLCNLDQIPPPYHSFIVSVLPVKWRGASAAPVRAVAVIVG